MWGAGTIVLMTLLAVTAASPTAAVAEENSENTTTKTAIPGDVCREGPLKDTALVQCEALIPKYTFSLERGTCEGYIYGGCGGSGNLFDSREDCEQRCKHLLAKA